MIFDENGDGTLGQKEFQDLKSKILSQRTQRLRNQVKSKSKYDRFDLNDDGKISAKEISQALKITLKKAEEMVKKYDENGDGSLDPKEFAILKKSQQFANSINVTTKIKDLDRNSDGKLSAEELAKATNITLKKAQDIIKKYDENGDGSIDEEEFGALKKQILKKQTQRLLNNLIPNTKIKDLDENSDNKLSFDELAKAVKITPKQAKDIIAQYDKNGNGYLDSEEFTDLKNQILIQKRRKINYNLDINTKFADMDKNGDGKLSATELAKACNITREQARFIIKKYDKNGDGSINAQEFVDLKAKIFKKQRSRIEDHINEYTTMQDLDGNGDGTLSADELAKACNITKKQATNIIRQYDENGDGEIDEQEFERMKEKILTEQIKRTFVNLDKNGDKKISAQELAKACDISLKEAKEFIMLYDHNGDGFLNEEEFLKIKEELLHINNAYDQYENEYDEYNQYDDDDVYEEYEIYDNGYDIGYHDSGHYVEPHYYVEQAQPHYYAGQYLFGSDMDMMYIVHALLVGICLLPLILLICCVIGGGLIYQKEQERERREKRVIARYEQIPMDRNRIDEV
eukprot:CAMPEP_0201577206 /NCGR_PEP_ID=MMETSP0190_2-20130828/23462_1 /ASSEMBLY_ACC=CAM_ASM_000263 /TAXON_ID=37353 /ORGANISM="Rosalina sp." /LENGTH=573 /DNA_ID=CAMNT_0048008981 /DNA_START=1320 /DNA_END=3041 /DNA_ORIENTATION=-